MASGSISAKHDNDSDCFAFFDSVVGWFDIDLSLAVTLGGEIVG